MVKVAPVSLGLLLALGVGACAGGMVGTAYTGSYDPGMLRYATGKGDMYTQIIGNPFDAPKATVEQAVTSSMYGAHFGEAVRFSTTRNPDNTSPYWVVVMFNPAPSTTPYNLCQGTAQEDTRIGGTLRVMAVFCAGTDRETSVTGRIARVEDPGDASLAVLIRQMTAQLFPPRNPDPNGGVDFNT